MRWADCEDGEGKEKEEQETTGERQQEAVRQQQQETEEERQEEARQEEAESKKEQEAERKQEQEQEQEGDREKEAEEKKDQEEGARQEELTNEEPPGLEEREESKHKAHEEEIRTQEAREEEERREQEAREDEIRAQEEREKEAKAQEERREEERKVQAQEGHEEAEEVTTQEKCVEAKKETNSMQEECDVSKRHMTWWKNAWWIRMDGGPHMRTARCRRRIWRADRRAAEQARDDDRVEETEPCRRGRGGDVGKKKERERDKAMQWKHFAPRNPLANNHSGSSNAATVAAEYILVKFEDIVHWSLSVVEHGERNDSWSHFGSRLKSARSVQNFGLPFVSMSVRDALHQLIADLHGDLLREISAFTCVHWQGLGQAARALRKRKVIDGASTKELILLDGAYNLSRHITVISANQFRMSIGNSIKTFAVTSCIDEIQTDTATVLVDPSLAVPCAATASPLPPVSVIEHATFAPVDVYTKPAPVIELMPAPVIEHIAPSAAESYPSFVPSFDQIHEAVTDSENSKFFYHC